MSCEVVLQVLGEQSNSLAHESIVVPRRILAPQMVPRWNMGGKSFDKLLGKRMLVADKYLWELGLDCGIVGNKSQEGDVRLGIAGVHWFLAMRFSRRQHMLGDHKTFAPTIVVRNRSFVHVNEERDFVLLARSFPSTLGPL